MPGAYPPINFMENTLELVREAYKKHKVEFSIQEAEQIQHYLNNRTFMQRIKGLWPYSIEHGKKIAAKEVLKNKLKLEDELKDVEIHIN